MSSIDIERQGAVAVLTMNHPERRNALDLEMRRALLAALRELAEDDAVRALVLTGAGNAFCAGADVSRMGGRDLAGARERMKTLHAMVLALHGLDKPVVAAVRGAAVGIGFSLAMACDVAIASPSADFSQVFTRVGLAPDGGAIWFLARQLGMSRAKELVLSGRKLRAEEALALGLVARVVPEEQVLSDALALAAEYAAGPTLALAMAKQLFGAAVAPGLAAFLEQELLVGPQLAQTSDHAEGRAAFQDKRKPRFTGR
ncbi:MAG: enoyl-CoA hydratase/isomerase family protein [Rubrivivax sp.]|nr:enoyl-CoA hydratase/isomerase family protein [Rubrivivax sp.]